MLTKTITSMDIVERLRIFMYNEAHSCSMDFGRVTAKYVYRMWGGEYSIEEIRTGLNLVRKDF